MANIAVIFDMDGLMLDTERMAQRAWIRALTDCGFQLDHGSFLRTVGCSVEDTGRILTELFGPQFDFSLAYKRRQVYYDQDIADNGIHLKPGLLELLAFLEERKVPKAVASSAPCWFASIKLDSAKINHHFPVVVCSDHVQRAKPAPDLFIEAARQIDFQPAQCIVLEDSTAGIRAAHAAGMLPVMIPDLISPSAEIQQIAYRVLPSLNEVIPLLDKVLLSGMPADYSRPG
jgi:HAD superfamily hydrolase (TIGR01509 family)